MVHLIWIRSFSNEIIVMCYIIPVPVPANASGAGAAHPQLTLRPGGASRRRRRGVAGPASGPLRALRRRCWREIDGERGECVRESWSDRERKREREKE